MTYVEKVICRILGSCNMSIKITHKHIHHVYSLKLGACFVLVVLAFQ